MKVVIGARRAARFGYPGSGAPSGGAGTSNALGGATLGMMAGSLG